MAASLDLRCHEELQELQEHAGRSSTVYRDSGHGSLSPPQAALQPLFTYSYQDPVLLEDARVFRNMLEIEEFYLAASNYFHMVQQEIKPNMRQIVTSWMLEVCMDQNCQANTFLLSCNIMDRFLSQLNIKKSQFQLVAAATMFIASKLADACPITGSELVRYTNDTYKLSELLEMELLILSKLKWDLSAVTPYDFLEHLLRLLQDDVSLLQKTNAERIIIACAKEFRFSLYPPSMLSSAAIAIAAALDLTQDSRDTEAQLVRRLQELTRVENDCLTNCIHEMRANLGVEEVSPSKRSSREERSSTPSSPSSPSTSTQGERTTPTEVLKVVNYLYRTDEQF